MRFVGRSRISGKYVTYMDTNGEKQAKLERKLAVEVKSLVYLRGKCVCLQQPSRSGPYLINVTDHALHFWRTGSDAVSLLAGTNYKVAAPFLSDYPINTNMMTSIPHLSHWETVR